MTLLFVGRCSEDVAYIWKNTGTSFTRNNYIGWSTGRGIIMGSECINATTSILLAGYCLHWKVLFFLGR